jgi:acetyl esterase/lipase
MIHGRPRRPIDMAPLAEVVAHAGAVVYNVDYRGVRPVGPGWPEAPEDIACAMRYARETAAQYGGDPSTLVWYRGSPARRPEAWRQGDFRNHLGENPDLAVRIIHELGDPVIPPRQARQFFRALRDAGYDVQMELIEGDAHFALLDPAGNGALVVPLVLELLGIEE